MSMIGHNMPPEEPEGGWRKQYFYMPVEEAAIIIGLLETFKKTVPFPSSKSGKSMTQIVDGRIDFLRKKLGLSNESKGGSK